MHSVIRILKMRNLADVSKGEQREFFKSFDYVMSDMDGVIWTKYQVHKGAADCLNALKSMGKRVHYVTNNSIAKSEDLAKLLRLNKFDAKDEDVTNPQHTVIDHLKEKRFEGTLYAMVTENVRAQIRNAGFTVAPPPEYPIEESIEAMTKYLQDDPNVKAILTGINFNMTFLELQKALMYLKREDCSFFTCGTDMEIPIGPIGPLIGTGRFTEILSSISNRKPINIAKPSLLSCAHVNKKLGIQKPNRALFIGD
ncbi:unnamed protein product [Acanthoscelides obtectus]|nr:unnamed protein product [Acanthoscelides obtectus]CAK1661124.1 Pyridoxal phosphate phosphatase [Acanthoscelides obtectus]